MYAENQIRTMQVAANSALEKGVAMNQSEGLPNLRLKNPFALAQNNKVMSDQESEVHIIRTGFICDTEPRGHARPGNKPPIEIVVDATEGFVPLWMPNETLRWRFQERSMSVFADPAAAKAAIAKLLGEALLAWDEAVPIKFSRRDDAWDFEIVVRSADECDRHGCVLATAFFPDSGRHRLVLYPSLFGQGKKELVDTMAHELGHIFGLRHFFAQISETRWASEIFGVHSPFSIMNYGEQSELTPEDRSDLKTLYTLAWRAELDNVNGTPIRFMKPYHSVSMVPLGDCLPFNYSLSAKR